MKFASYNKILFFSIFFILYFITLSACSDDVYTESYNDTGSIDFAISVSYSTEDQGDARTLMATNEECEYSGVESVKAEIYDNMNNLLAEGGPWACSLDSATIDNVPAGLDYKIVILCFDSNGNVKYRGEQTNIEVSPNAITILDTIHVYLFYPILFCPKDNAIISDSSFFLEWEYVLKAKKFKIIVSKNEDLSEPIKKVITDDDTLFYNISDLESNVIYYWQVSAIDFNNNQSTGSDTWDFVIDPDYPYKEWCDYE